MEFLRTFFKKYDGIDFLDIPIAEQFFLFTSYTLVVAEERQDIKNIKE